jgi:hypothetical protein
VNAFDISMAGRGAGRLFDLTQAVFHGTAFCMAPGLFVTAAHVFQDASAVGEVALARLAPGRHDIRVVEDAEVYEGIDLALLRCERLAAEVLPFSFQTLPLLFDVISAGYPFGLELPRGFPNEPPTYHLRAFKGYVVTRRSLRHLTATPPGYEISFVPPMGLSGAPLMIGDFEPRAVAGIILMHHHVELGDRTMDVGMALDAEEILTLGSRIVGGSIAEKLFNRPKLTR